MYSNKIREIARTIQKYTGCQDRSKQTLESCLYTEIKK